MGAVTCQVLNTLVPTFLHLGLLVLYVCLSAKSWQPRTWHPLPTLQNNEPVSQVIETGCKPVLLKLTSVQYALQFKARVGVIIDCPQKDLFHDLMNVILMSRMALSEMADNKNDKDWQLVSAKDWRFWEKSRILRHFLAENVRKGHYNVIMTHKW